MKAFAVEIREVERHQLERPFEKNRLDDKTLEPLVKSLKEHGQQVPVTVVGPGGTLDPDRWNTPISSPWPMRKRHDSGRDMAL